MKWKREYYQGTAPTMATNFGILVTGSMAIDFAIGFKG
jgi:hypothetical protein